MTPLHHIEARDLILRPGDKVRLGPFDFSLNPGACVGIIGPNGAGKTTLLRGLLGRVPAMGWCNLWDVSDRVRAQSVAWVDQDRSIGWALLVREVIGLGLLSRPDAKDRLRIQDAADQLKIGELLDRVYTHLSGGERALVMLARAMVQDAPILLADEPIAALDPAHALEVMGLLRQMADQGRAVALSIHDLGLAYRFCTYLVLVDQGHIVTSGSVDQVLDDQNIADIFKVRVHRHMAHGVPLLVPTKRIEEG